MKNCIVTPTFSGHFQYIPDYLKSFSELAMDKDQFEICFTISKSEKSAFDKIIEPFKDLNIKVLLFEDLLKKFKVSYTPDELLEKYERYSFQTLKKFYTMLYLGPDYRFLILDSESILLNKCNIGTMFDDFFNAPFISCSDFKKRIKSDRFILDVKCNTSYILKSKKIQNLWFLENFVWFYDYNILNDMLQEYGSPFDIVNNLYKNAWGKRNIAVFEIDLYQSFVYLHHKKYKYNVIDVDCIISAIPYGDVYKNKHVKTFNGGTGMLEHATLFLTKQNVKPLAQVFKDNRFNIIRCDQTIPSNYKLQRTFLDVVQPNILAASQDHCFGIKNTFKQRAITAIKNTKIAKVKSHIDLFVRPIGHLLQWAYQPVYLVFSVPMLGIKFLKNMFLLHRH